MTWAGGTVTGEAAEVGDDREAVIVVGTIGHSPIVDEMAKKRQIDASQLKGCREKFLITMVGSQLPAAYRAKTLRYTSTESCTQ